MGRHRLPVSSPAVSSQRSVIAGQVMILQASASSMHTLVETLMAFLTYARVVSYLEARLWG